MYKIQEILSSWAFPMELTREWVTKMTKDN